MQENAEPAPQSRRRRKEARPSEIIAAAMALWRERGFAATRLEDVAKGAGIAKSTIYLYFASKEALFEAAVEERIEAGMAQAQLALQSPDSTTEELLLAYFARIRKEMVEGGSFIFLKVLLAEGHRFPDLVARYEQTVLRRGIDAVQNILRRGVARGELRPEALEFEPRLIMAPAMMLSLWGTVFPGIDVPDVEVVHKQNVAFVLASLSAKAPDP